MNLAKASARAAAPAAKPETTPAAPRGTAESSGVASALSRFNAYIRIECGLALDVGGLLLAHDGDGVSCRHRACCIAELCRLLWFA